MSDIILVMPIANRFDKVSIRIPNGLLAVAALPDKAGYSVKIIDLKLDNNWRQTLKQSMDRNTLCVGISCSTGRMIENGLEVAGYVKRLNPELPLVWGGPHPTLLPEQTLAHPLVDIVTINEADKSFMDLVNTLSDRKDLSGVEGIGYKKDGKVIINLPAPLIRELDNLPIFPYHLLDVSKYSSLKIGNSPSLDIVTSRGCPFNCAFCSTPVTSHRLWRAVSAERIIENISLLKARYRIKTFYLVDDNFMVDLRRVERFLDALKEAKLNIYWGTQGVRVETINDMSSKLLDRIEASGCRELSIGVESANPHILKLINKKITIGDVFKANERLTGRRIAIKYNMMIGFPGENMEGIKNTVRCAIELYKKNKNVWFPFNIYTPFPGTAMFKLAEEYGFKPPERFEGWARLESTGWDRFYEHWLDEKDNKLLKSINATSYLAFPSAAEKIGNPLLKRLFKLYQPFAHFRFKHMFYFMHLEKCLITEKDSGNY